MSREPLPSVAEIARDTGEGGAEEARPWRPLDAALRVELHRLDSTTVSVWQIFGLIGVVYGGVVGATVSRSLGLGCAAAAGVFVVAFRLIGRGLSRAPGAAAPRIAMVCLESAVPWVFTTIVVVTQGPVYALGSWVPPMLFCALVLAAGARLRPMLPLLSGLSGAVFYQVFYWALVRGMLTEEQSGFLLYQPAMQVTRSVSIALAGVLGALVARGMRRAIRRAEGVAREQDLFGKYRVVREIAQGGMGTVSEAVYCPEGGFERRVAVKRVHAHLSGQKKFIDAFRYEAELSARLAHPNIVLVLDFGRVGEAYFLAMEYVDGVPLSAIVARLAERESGGALAGTDANGYLPVSLVGFLGREILAALAYAHEAARGTDGQPLRVVHRDVCPQNILVSLSGEVKMGDFGVARAMRESAVAFTQSTAGHVAYMAPEQARGAPVDARADLFPTGVILWELCTGRRLFLRDNEPATLLALVSGGVPAATALRAGLDPAWDAFLERALERDPERRFASARAMAEALDGLPGVRGERSAEALGAIVEAIVNGPQGAAPSQADIATVDLSSRRA